MSPALLGEQLAIDFPSATTSFEVTYIRRDAILPDPEQPRKDADADLRASIARNGVLQPITVRPHPKLAKRYYLVDGERRWRGSEGILDALPCLVREDQEDAALRLRTQLVANTGKPLTPLEEARAFAALLEAQGDERSVEQLSAELGRPVSSIHERLGLLELGPWIPLIEDGTVGLSHAVKVLLPLRGCAEAAHVHAIAVVQKDYRFSREDGGGMTLHAFTQVAHQAYRAQLYPLTKTKSSWDPQPLFDTKRHDAECDCGRVMFALGTADAKRACCGNPEWWRPRHRKAKAAQPKKPAGRGADRSPSLSLPEGSTTKKVSWHGDAVKGCTPLTQSYALQWRVDDFDPSALATLPPEKLVLIQAPSGSYVATTDTRAVEEARRAWGLRWFTHRQNLLNAAWTAMQEKGRAYRVTGAGVGELLACLELTGPQMYDALVVARIPLAKGADKWPSHSRDAYRPALAALTEKQHADLASAIAFLCGTKTGFASDAVEKLRDAEVRKIRAKRLPWLAKPTPAKKGKGAKVAAPAAALEDDEELSEDDDWEDEE